MVRIKDKPIAEQIAEYENEIQRIDIRIANGKAKQCELRRLIRQLQTPEAETAYRKRMALKARQQIVEARKNEDALQAEQRAADRHERNQARIERELEECLRNNGKIA